jgi:hypothetical protein
MKNYFCEDFGLEVTWFQDSGIHLKAAKTQALYFIVL